MLLLLRFLKFFCFASHVFSNYATDCVKRPHGNTWRPTGIYMPALVISIKLYIFKLMVFIVILAYTNSTGYSLIFAVFNQYKSKNSTSVSSSSVTSQTNRARCLSSYSLELSLCKLSTCILVCSKQQYNHHLQLSVQFNYYFNIMIVPQLSCYYAAMVVLFSAVSVCWPPRLG